MKRRKNIDPSPIGELLPGVLRRLGPRPGSPLAQVRAVWADVVGPETAARAKVAGLEGGILRVEVASAPVKHHLATFRRDEVLATLRKRLPGVRLKAVRYRLGSLR